MLIFGGATTFGRGFPKFCLDFMWAWGPPWGEEVSKPERSRNSHGVGAKDGQWWHFTLPNGIHVWRLYLPTNLWIMNNMCPNVGKFKAGQKLCSLSLRTANPFPLDFVNMILVRFSPGNTFSVYQIWSWGIIWPSHTCHAKWTWKLDPGQIPSHDPSIESLGLGGGGILCFIDIHPLRLGNIAYAHTWHYSSWLCFSDCLNAAKTFFCMKVRGEIRPIEMPWNIAK